MAHEMDARGRGGRWPLLLILLPLGVFLWAGFAGIDFGKHWDEDDHTANVARSLETRTLLPMGMDKVASDELRNGYYGYPSVLYWIGMASALPEILRDLPAAGGVEAVRFVRGQEFLLRFRAACLVLSSLGIVWVGLAAWVLTRRAWAALIAAALLATSWEINYHARWVAADALVMQWAGLCLLCCALALTSRTRPRWWLRLAAGAAGLAAGTKYPAGSLLLIVWIAAAAVWQRGADLRRWRDWLGLAKSLAALAAILAVVFLLTTPGALLQPWHFWSWLDFNRRHYGEIGHLGYTVRSPLTHLGLIGTYLGLDLFSPAPFISAAVIALAAAGIAWLAWRRHWAVAALLLVFPLAYLAYFAGQIVMVVRNLLILGPFVAVAAGIGACAILTATRPAWLRVSLALALAGAIAWDGAWTVRAGLRVAKSSAPQWQAKRLGQYAQAHPEVRLYFTDAVRGELARSGRFDDVLARAATLADADFVATNVRGPEAIRWLANRRTLAAKVVGPAEVNIRYYPTWAGADRIALVPPAHWSAIPDPALQHELRVHRLRSAAPAGFALVAYEDLGREATAGAAPPATGPATTSSTAGARFEVIQGIPFTFPILPPDLQAAASVVYHRSAVRIRIRGLEPSQRYRVGWSWLDFFGGTRAQAVHLAAPGADRGIELRPVEDLPNFENDPFDPSQRPAEFVADIPPDLISDGAADLLIVGQSGPNAMVGEVWLYEQQ